MSKQWRDIKVRGTSLSKGSAKGNKSLGEKETITNKLRPFIFGNCHLALAGCTKDGIQASLPSPIFEAGTIPNKDKAVFSVGKKHVDVVTDFENQPDQWCQAFTFAMAHVLDTRPLPCPLDILEALLFISRDGAKETLNRAYEHAMKSLEKREIKKYNEMLPIWDDAFLMELSTDADKYSKANRAGKLNADQIEMIKWVQHIIVQSVTRKSHDNNYKHNAKSTKPAEFKSFFTRKPKGSHLFEVEAGVILSANPIAHLRKHKYGWLFYKAFFDYAIEYILELVFRDYGGVENALETQLAYLENDLDIQFSNIKADKFFRLLEIMETIFKCFAQESCSRLGNGNSIPDANKKRITFNAMHIKYKKQLEARSYSTESAFTTWDEMKKTFIECQRAFDEEEKTKKQKEQKTPSQGDKKGGKKRKADEDSTVECSYCRDLLKVKEPHKLRHNIEDCRKRIEKEQGGKNNDSKPWKKQRVNKEFAALVRNSKMSQEELLAMLNKKEE